MFEELYSIYKEKLEGGHYHYPPLIIIKDILERKYPKERLDFIVDENCYGLYRGIDYSSEVFFKKIYDSLLNEYTSLTKIMDSKSIMGDLNDAYLLIDFCGLSSMTVLIHYPEILIKNSQEKSHIIKDLFVEIKFDKNGKLANGFRILRSTYTISELRRAYCHSHCPSIAVCSSGLSQWKDPCLGSGPISSKVGLLSNIYDPNDFSELLICSFFEELDAYLAWESIEGVPYKYIRDIHNGLSDINSKGLSWDSLGTVTDPYFKTVKDIIIEANIKDFLKIISITHEGTPKYKIIFDEYKLINHFTKIFNTKAPDKINHHRLILDDLSYEYVLNNDIKHLLAEIDRYKELENTPIITFKGRAVLLNIIDDTKILRAKLDSNKVVNPCLIKTYIIKLENILNKQYSYDEFSQSEL